MYCKNCSNKFTEFETIKESKVDSKQDVDPFAKNYKKIFNVCFYSVIGCVASIILISFFVCFDWACFIGTNFYIYY